MGPMPLLSDAEITAALSALPGWSRSGDEIEKTFELDSFPDAIAFVVRIGFLAEAADHHPDLDVRWRRLRVALTTHDAGGLTTKDARARASDRRDRLTVPLVIALVIVALLLLFMWIAVGREPGPGPSDVAIAYERAWDELDFDLLYDLSGAELRDGLRRDQFVAAKRSAYSGAGKGARIGARVTVETSVAGNQTALVVTRVEVDGGSVRNNVMLDHTANGWVVVSYSLRAENETAPPSASA